MKVAIVLIVLTMAFGPIASGYLNKNIDSTEYVLDKTCFCHDPEQSTDVDVIVDAPLQVSFTPDNRSVRVGIGILSSLVGLNGFGLMLEASEDDSNVKWERSYENSSGQRPVANDLLKVNGTVLYSVGPVLDDWFNLSFIPGNTNQTLELTVIGMRADGNGNETGDQWVIEERIIEVKEQRLMRLSVVLSNDNPIAVSDVLVEFYMDDENIGNHTVPHVPGNGQENASIDWDVTFKEDGKYTFRAVIDPMGQVTETDKSNNEVTRTIWLGGPPEEIDYTLYYAGAAIIVVVTGASLAYLLYRRRLYRF
jgi:hypothetical protein